MADRTVSVELKLKSDQYKAEIEASKVATEGLDRKVEELDKDINKIPPDAAKAAAGVGLLGESAKTTGGDVDDLEKKTTKARDEFGRFKKSTDEVGAGVEDLGKKTETLGEKTKASADETGKLDKRIAELKDSVRNLGAEFDRTGDPALLKKFRADSSELAGLIKMRTEFEKLPPVFDDLNNKTDRASFSWSTLVGWMKAGRQALLDFGGKGGTGAQVEGPFAGGLTSPVALGVGAAAVVPALAAAGGAIGALGGAGGAGLGVAGAVMGNPEAFKTAWGAATGEVKKDLIDAGAAFSGPTMEAIRSIGPTVAGWHLKEALAPAVQYVPELVKGVEGFATGVERGFADLVANAGPEVQVLSDGMVQFGDAVGTAFSSIASGAQGGAQALHDTITIVSDLVIAIGAVTGASEKAFGFIHDHPIMSAIMTGGLSLGITAWDAVAGSADKAKQSVTDAGSAAAAAGPDFGALSSQLNATKVDVDSLAETMSLKLLNATMGIDRATLSFDQALLNVSDSVKKNGHNLDEHTVKGLANRQMMLSLVQANIAEYQANVNAGMGAEAAAKAYDDGTAALERQLRKAGFTQAAIDGLIGKYKGVPKNIDTDIAINGLTDAINSLGDLIAQINHIAGHNFHSTVTVDYIANRSSLYNQQVPQGHAAGGITRPGLGWVGEKGPELVDWNGGERVYNASESRAMMASSGPSGYSSAGQSAVAVSLVSGSGANLTPLGSLINQMIRDGLIVVKASQVRPGV